MLASILGARLSWHFANGWVFEPAIVGPDNVEYTRRIPVNVATSRLSGGCGGSWAEDPTWRDAGGKAGVVRSADHAGGE